MYELEVPFAHAGLEVHGHERFREQIGARPVPAVVIAGPRFNRQVREAQFRIDADLRPCAGVSGIRPRVLEPGVVAELAAAGDGLEDPEPLAGAHVEGADETLHVALPCRHAARAMRGAHDDVSPAMIGVECSPISRDSGSTS